MNWLADTASALSADGLVLLFAKALLVLCLGGLLADDVGNSAAAVRHRARFATLLCLLALPLLAPVAPRWHLPIPGGGEATTGPLAAILAGALFAYLLGVALLALGLARDLAILLGVTLRAGPAPESWRRRLAGLDAPRRLRLLASDAIDSPLTWGHLRPVILVPAHRALSATEQRMVLLHELGHIRRGDWLAHLLGRIVRVLYWPIPGLRDTLRQLSLESEQACDNHVLAAPQPATDYAALLLGQARRRRLEAAVPLSRQSELAHRIRSLCSPRADHSISATGWPWLLPLCLLLTLPLAGLRPGPQLALPGTPQAATATPSLRLLPPTAPAPGGADSPGLLPERVPQPGAAPGSVVGGDWGLPGQPVFADATPPPGAAVDVDLSAATPASGIRQAAPRIQAAYPLQARRRQIEGAVTARYDVNADGRIINPRILRAAPAGIFEDSVLAALRGGHYPPPRLQGRPAALRDLEITFRFRLREPARPP